ncbi:Voltage-dependent T-type calcium channel subunit alpha-1I [Armadillidium nasatum]|uniref:Voltage-dependent T-type calcium channel subunit alpha-1I n=1 Tax=Armadillidium nasatum TaxID=96803 RepID=A0A5N5T7E0_9CRUS|nr:Voltage-dependent T-type calcium channel subunit alpha-1I [Armadillidium nasatum]
MAKGIRALLDTVMQALPQVGNLGLLFFLLFFIFAALGVELFGRLECDENHPCQGLGEHAHFKNFGMAFLTLFRVATGDNWNGIMKDTLRDECNDSDDCVKNCCLYPFVAPIFFVIFVLMAQFVLVNVVVAVLMKHLEESHKQMEDEYDMDVEIERQIAQEEEDIAEMQENISNMKIAQEKLKAAANISNEETLKNRKHFLNLSSSPVCKIPFLPETLALRGHRGSDPGYISYYRGSPIASDFYHRKDDVSLVIPSININDRDLRRRDSVQIAIIPKERRSPLIQRAQSMSRDDRLPPFPRYRVEVRQRASTSSERKTSSPLPSEKIEPKDEKENLSRKSNAPTPSKPLSRDGSAKRVTIDASAKTNDANSSSPGVSPRGQRQRQLNWHRRRKSSSGSYKVSMDDSISQSLMASFEISGRVDVDSTSCSVCSSEDVSNITSSLGNSPRNCYCPSPRVLARYNASEASLSDSLPHCPEVPLDEEEATLASSNDSFATDTVPPEFSGDSSSLSEAAANLPVPPSPRLPRRHDRQVRSLHGLRPRPRPVVSREPLSSSLNELPRYQRRSSPLPQRNNTSTLVDSAPQSPNLARRDTNRSTNSDCGVPYTRRISGEFHQEPPSFHSS